MNSIGDDDTDVGEHAQPDNEVRILRRIAPLDEWPITNAIGPDGPVIAVIDTETEGLDPETDRVIEIAAALVKTDAEGRITGIIDKIYGLQDPGRPLPAKIKTLTGLSDERLQGRSIDIDKMTVFLCRADALLAHGARFDAGFCRRLLPGIAHLPWVCTLNDIDWLGHQFDGRALGHLLCQQGLYAPKAHTAGDDVTAAINLAATVLPNGRTVLAEALANARTTSVRVDAEGPTYGARGELKRRGYSFDWQRKSWSIETSEFHADYEHSWIDRHFPQIRVSKTPITWHERHC
ncbi:exonuclease domain-containing protein [Erythrobacter sp.]|uniref:exonuclease domain-containing protein n=1 Tax=Erythrobacter sp. TaxID=1042 RepID=UPI0025FA6876|nr:exonuclease domain-containing protein [Erythrobacter sp.]